MQRELSPVALVVAGVVTLVLVVLLLYRIFTTPSSVPARGAQRGTTNPYATGGPTEADLQRMREYNAAHPGAASSRQ